MLMITGPTSVDKAPKASRKRRASDVSAEPRPDVVAKAAPAARLGRRSTDRKLDPAPQPTEPRSAAPEIEPGLGRSYAPLVAQLIAGKLGVAQTRLRRRGTVAEAAAAYRRPRNVEDEATLEAEA